MSSRLKEEERIERIIRNLLKLPENRRCINCNSLGPQYVCTTFWTFICTNCSGVHREFTHRVKSVSMAKFSADEVSALQAGGNERAREIYFKEWDPQRHSFPDSSNQNRLRDFIKHVYLDRKFTGERSMGTLAMVNACAQEDSAERRSFERPGLGGRVDDRNSRYCIDERRSPRYRPDSARSSGQRNRPVHFEVVDDRFRGDRFGSGRRSEIYRPSNAEVRTGSRSPVSRKSREMTGPPTVRPVSDILGENVPPLQVGESTKANEKRANEFACAQKISSSSESGSVDVKSLGNKRVDSGSLIDFSADNEPADPAAASQTALSVEGGNEASIQSSAEAKSSDIPNVNSLEALLFGLSVPAAGPVDIMSEAPGTVDAPSAAPVASSSSVGALTKATIDSPATPETGNSLAASPGGMPSLLPNSSSDSTSGVTDGPLITQQNQSSSYLCGDSSSTTERATTVVGALRQEGPANVSAESSRPSSEVAQVTNFGSPALQGEIKSFDRKELPLDLFTSSYSSFSAPAPGWQIRPPHGMGFSMPYHPTAMNVAAFAMSDRSRNPFDLDDDTTQEQVPVFPSMLPAQGSLPNLSAPSSLSHASCTHSSQLMQPQASYAPIAPSQLPSHGMQLFPVSGAFMGQQLPNDMSFSRQEKTSTAISGEDAFASLNPIQHPGSRHPAPASSNSFSSAGGNPFG